MWQTLGMIAAVTMPLWNVPLILKIERRKSSGDISRWWTVGVWISIILMLPSGLASPDRIFRLFTIINTCLFTGVLIQVFRYR